MPLHLHSEILHVAPLPARKQMSWIPAAMRSQLNREKQTERARLSVKPLRGPNTLVSQYDHWCHWNRTHIGSVGCQCGRQLVGHLES